MDTILHNIWQFLALVLTGAVGAGAVKWVAGWLEGKGANWVKAELDAVQKKMNENSILGQISADDAAINILKQVIPLAIHNASDDLQTRIASGKLTSGDIKQIATDVWTHAEDQIRGGVNDYLKNSSFQDGQVLAETVVKRFFANQSAVQQGLIVDAARVDASAAATTAGITTK